MFEAVYTPVYRIQRAGLGSDQQDDLDRTVRLLELDPHIDGVTKFRAVAGGEVVSLYDDDRWQIVYRIVDDRFLEMLGVDRV